MSEESSTPQNVSARGGGGSVAAWQQIHDLQQKLSSLAARRHDPYGYPPVFDAEITGAGSGGDKYTWKELISSGSGVEDWTDGRVCTDATHASAAVEINGWKWLPSGTRVRMVMYNNGTDSLFTCVVAIPPPTADSGTDYILGYDGTGKKLTWIETTTTCPGG